MTRRRAPSRFAERALTDISLWGEVQADPAKPTSFTPGRHSAQASERWHQSALTGVVSCAEVFTSDLLRHLLPSVTEQDVFSWPKREKAWRQHLHLALDTLQHWPALRGFVEARNAIQHGLGTLTNSQLGIATNKPRDYNRREETLSMLRAAQIRLDADRVVLSAEDIARCIRTASAFVHELDERSYQAGLALRSG